MDKLYITADELLEDSFRLAAKIYASGFRPDLLLGAWRGGAPVAIGVQEFLAFKGLETDHMPLRLSSYTGIDRRAANVRLDGLEAVLERVTPGSAILLVDDVFDTGCSAQAVHDALSRKLDAGMGGSLVQTRAAYRCHQAGLLSSRNRQVAGIPPRDRRPQRGGDPPGQGWIGPYPSGLIRGCPNPPAPPLGPGNPAFHSKGNYHELKYNEII